MHPVFLQVGPLTIRYYGLMYVLAIAVGFALLKREVIRKRLGLSTDDLLDLLLWTVPAAIVGARLYYVLFRWDHYGANLIDILKLWEGGLAIHGGVLAGIVSVFLFSRRKGVRFWRLTDAIAPSLILGQAIGRIGNFTNGDAFGLPTNAPWGLQFPLESPAGAAFPGMATHPSMLYEMMLNLGIFAVLWSVRRKGFRDGFSTALYFVLYAVARSIVSFTRADSLWLGRLRVVERTLADGSVYETTVGAFRAAHAISLAFILAFGVMIWRSRLYARANVSAQDRNPSPK
jgi:phosphatidylglycerol---prolipoprotein diacylglyceryl transferase